MSARFASRCAGLLMFSATLCSAADKPDDAAAIQQAVAKSVESYAAAFKARDAAAVAALFTPEAEYIDGAGTIFHGRKAIEAESAASFAAEPAGTIEIEVISIRPIAAGVVVEEGVSTFQPAEAGPSSATHYTATHVKQPDGTWLMASVRELQTAALSPHDRLLTLKWLTGDWREDAGDSSVSTTWKWSEDGNFLISEFKVHNVEGVSLTGTQRIGWDAERQQFRSWVFESNGSAVDGWWTPRDDGSWSVHLHGVGADGARISSVLTYSSDGADGLVITQDQRMRGGVTFPSSTHRVVRQPPAPTQASR